MADEEDAESEDDYLEEEAEVFDEALQFSDVFQLLFQLTGLELVVLANCAGENKNAMKSFSRAVDECQYKELDKEGPGGAENTLGDEKKREPDPDGVLTRQRSERYL